MEDKFKIQDNLYNFPYHYIPHFDVHGIPHIHRELIWGWDYLTYMEYTLNYIRNHITDNQRIIDIGCGDGYLLNNLNINGIIKVGIDLSDKAIRFANAFNNDTKFIKQSIYEISEQFDMIVLNEVMEHIPDEEISTFMNHVKKLVKKKGRLIITVPSIDIPVNKKHFRHYTLELIVNQLGSTQFQLEHSKKLFIQSKRLKRIQWLLNNQFFLIKNKGIIQSFWAWHKKNTFQSDNKKAHHIFAVFSRII